MRGGSKPDEDVRAVETGVQLKDRAESAVVRRKADA